MTQSRWLCIITKPYVSFKKNIYPFKILGCLKLIKFFSGEKCEDLLSQNKSIWFYIYSINISNPPEIGRNCIPFINEVWTLIGPTSLETPKQWFRLVLNEIQLQARQSQQEQSS